MTLVVPRHTSEYLAIKPGQAVFVSNNLTSGARKLWNILLYMSRDEVLAAEPSQAVEHFVPYSDLVKFIAAVGLDSDSGTPKKSGDISRLWLRKIIKELRDTDIQVLHLDEHIGEQVITETKYLAEATWSKSGILFSFGPRMRRFMLSKMQAHIDLITQSRLKSKHSQVLYEIACFLATADVLVSQKTIALGNAVNMLVEGNTERYQKDTGIFNTRVIQPALEELGRETDLILDVEYIKEKIPGKRGRPKCIGVKFNVKANETLPEHLRPVFPLTEQERTDVSSHEIYIEVKALVPGLNDSWMHAWIAKYPFDSHRDYWRNSIDAYRQWISAKMMKGETVNIPARGFKQAIEEGWKPNQQIAAKAQEESIDIFQQLEQTRSQQLQKDSEQAQYRQESLTYFDQLEQIDPQLIDELLQQYLDGDGSAFKLMVKGKRPREVTGFVAWVFRNRAA